MEYKWFVFNHDGHRTYVESDDILDIVCCGFANNNPNQKAYQIIFTDGTYWVDVIDDEQLKNFAIVKERRNQHDGDTNGNGNSQ